MRGGFIDETTIEVEAGGGGNGCFAYERLKYKPKGKPAGGSGGHGGSVYVKADPHISTLRDVSYKRKYRAVRGSHGGGANKNGKNGEDIIIRVPAGTLVYDKVTGERLGDCCSESEQITVARGGRGGRGNAALRSRSNPLPEESEPGRPGESRTLRLALKVLADVGLVGRPNAGKSTFISAVSNAHPRVAGYPFTTLQPHLGIVAHSPKSKGFVIADIPGLVENAHEGKGMGLNFLKHIERTRILAIMVESTSVDPLRDAEVLRNELAQYSEALVQKPLLYILTKSDLLSGDDRSMIPQGWMVISSVTGEGLDHLVCKFASRLGR